MNAACNYLRDNTDRVFVHWHELVELHHHMPSDLGSDSLPELVEALTEACVCGGRPQPIQKQLVRQAAEHGRERHDGGRPLYTIFTEFDILREAIWTCLREELSTHDATDAILHVDACITICVLASLRGYYGVVSDSTVACTT